MATRKYDSTVARIAGNIASGMAGSRYDSTVAAACVKLARLIVAETERTEPVNPVDSVDTRNLSGR